MTKNIKEMSGVKPVLFSGPMIRALLDGRKTMTRRVIKPQPPKGEYGDDYITRLNGPEWYVPAVVDKDGNEVPGKPIWGVYDELGEWGAPVPYMPGDLLWVREAIYLSDDGHEEYAVFAADQKSVEEHLARIDALPAYFPEELRAEHKRLRPSIHMPRWASRLTLEVTSVKVERLQEISIEDARAEGVATEEWEDWRENAQSIALPEGSRIEDERDLFRNLWNSLHGADACWDVNPWVCAISFIVHQMNVDDFLEQREKHKVGGGRWVRA